MDDSRANYKPPTAAKIMDIPYFPPEVSECKRLGPKIAAFVQKEVGRHHERLMNEFDRCTSEIWNNQNVPALERLQNLKAYMAQYEEICGDAFAAAFVALEMDGKEVVPSSDIIYAFCDKHAGGDMNSSWAITVEIAIDNYAAPEWPAEIARNSDARMFALSVLVDYLGEIEGRFSSEYQNIKYLIHHGH